ncbi:hypothetical protein TTRE_0000148001 [Trichuris trichiura]|uniref:Uncharacterized protein n=1 Tax=Trichuris trichiura TaxID=36087 RepID=A0A077YZK0_TRITR|nr:hypothetical protein TTRE_0000148001 [Trichuris trichiura]
MIPRRRLSLLAWELADPHSVACLTNDSSRCMAISLDGVVKATFLPGSPSCWLLLVSWWCPCAYCTAARGVVVRADRSCKVASLAVELILPS